jgi:drug/metabolite transporter (DMT)-like permease
MATSQPPAREEAGGGDAPVGGGARSPPEAPGGPEAPSPGLLPPPPSAAPAASSLAGLLLVLASSTCFSLSNLAVHLLSRLPEPRIPPLQTISVRFGFQLVLTLATLAATRRGRLAERATWMGQPGNWWKLLLRGGWGLLGVWGWFTLLTIMTFSDATAIVFTNVCLTGLFARLVLGEPFYPLDAAAAALGLVGVVLVAQPAALFGAAGAAAARPIAPLSVLLGLATACASAMAYVSARMIGAGESPLVITLWFGALGAALAPLACLASGGFVAAPSAAAAWLQVGAGLVGWLGQVLLNAGLSRAPVGPSSVMRYSELVLALGVQSLLLGDTPNALKWGGSLLVCSTVVSTVHRARAKAAAEAGLAAQAAPAAALSLEEDRRRYYEF